MDTQYVFPRPQPAIARPQKSAPEPVNQNTSSDPRHSNALRHSVLETALELGVGSSSTVTKWMFANPLTEEDEEDTYTEETSPGLTSGSTTTSDSSHASGEIIYSAPLIQQPGFKASQSNHTTQIAGVRNPNSTDPPPSASNSSSEVNTITMPGTDVDPIPEYSAPGTRKLLKKRSGDGQESDGGYISDSARKRKEKARKKKEDAQDAAMEKIRKEAEKEEKKRLKAELKAAERLRKKSATARDAPTVNELQQSGYETDRKGSSKSKVKKSKKSADGYETDDGYLSSGNRRRGFFKRSKKNTSAESKEDLQPSLIPALPVPLPVAERFATTLDNLPPALPPINRIPEGTKEPPSPPQIAADSKDEQQEVVAPLKDPSSFFEDDDDDNMKASGLQAVSSFPPRFLGRGRSSEDSNSPDKEPATLGISLPFGLGRRSNSPTVPAVSVQQDPLDSALRPPPQRTVPSLSLEDLSTPSMSRAYDEKQLYFTVGQRNSQLSIIPSGDYIVPSPQPSPGMRHSFHERPSPTPPPSSPLPAIPSPQALSPIPPPLSRSPSNDALSPPATDSIQRGRTSPFPTKPPNVGLPTSPLGGFEGRVRVPRYRDLYGFANSSQTGTEVSAPLPSVLTKRQPQVTHSQRDENSRSIGIGIDVEEPSDEEAEVDQLRDALIGRFKQPASDDDDDPHTNEKALDRSQSVTLRSKKAKAPPQTVNSLDPEYAPSRQVRFAEEQEVVVRNSRRETNMPYSPGIISMYGSSVDGSRSRDSRWTASVYSRASFVDDETSGSWRSRLPAADGEEYDENEADLRSRRRVIEKF